jgi:hypothetical protein
MVDGNDEFLERHQVRSRLANCADCFEFADELLWRQCEHAVAVGRRIPVLNVRIRCADGRVQKVRRYTHLLAGTGALGRETADHRRQHSADKWLSASPAKSRYSP